MQEEKKAVGPVVPVAKAIIDEVFLNATWEFIEKIKKTPHDKINPQLIEEIKNRISFAVANELMNEAAALQELLDNNLVVEPVFPMIIHAADNSNPDSKCQFSDHPSDTNDPNFQLGAAVYNLVSATKSEPIAQISQTLALHQGSPLQEPQKSANNKKYFFFEKPEFFLLLSRMFTPKQMVDTLFSVNKKMNHLFRRLKIWRGKINKADSNLQLMALNWETYVFYRKISYFFCAEVVKKIQEVKMREFEKSVKALEADSAMPNSDVSKLEHSSIANYSQTLSDEEFLVLIKKLSNLNNYPFPLNLESYTPDDAKLIVERVLQNSRAFSLVVKNMRALLLFPWQLPGQYNESYTERAIQRVLESDEDSARIFDSVGSVNKFLKFFPQYKNRILSRMLEKKFNFIRLIETVCDLRNFMKNFPEYSADILARVLENEEHFARIFYINYNTFTSHSGYEETLSTFFGTFPQYEESIKAKLYSSSFQKYAETALRKHINDADLSASKARKNSRFRDQYKVNYQELWYNALIADYRAKSAGFPCLTEEKFYFEKYADKDQLHKAKDIAASSIEAINFFLMADLSRELVLSVQDNDHCDNSQLYAILKDFKVNSSHLPSGVVSAPVIERGNRVLSITLRRSFMKDLDLLEEIGKITNEYCPPLCVTNRRLLQDSVTVFVDIKEWEKELRIKFSDPDLRLVRVTGKNGGSLRLLVVNPVLAQKIQSRLSDLAVGEYIDLHQTQVPFSQWLKFKKAVDALPAISTKKSKSPKILAALSTISDRESKEVGFENASLKEMQSAWTATLNNSSLNLRTIFPDGKESRVSFELLPEEADCFWQVVRQVKPHLLLQREGDRKFSISLKNFRELVNPATQLEIRKSLIETMVEDLRNWNKMRSQGNNNSIIVIEICQVDNFLVRLFEGENESKQLVGYMDYSTLCSYHASTKAKYVSSVTSNHSSSFSFGSGGGSVYSPGSSALFCASSLPEETLAPLPQVMQDPTAPEEKKFESP